MIRPTRHPAARLAGLSGALVLGLASGAGAVSITNLSVVLDAGNTANFLDDVGVVGSQLNSAVAVQTSSATNFITRYQEGVYTDAGGNGATTNSITLNSSYTISFDIVNAVGTNWQLDIATSRVGARTSVDDGQGSSAFSLGAVTGTRGGAGTLASGSLGLGAIANSTQANAVNLAFNQNGTATITGSGNGSVTLNFAWIANAQTIVAGNGNNAQGDEAAIRMGVPSTLSSFTAGQYPGSGNRTAANDGHFVDLDLIDLGPIPEPDTALLLGLGLAALGAQRSRARCSRRSA